MKKKRIFSVVIIVFGIICLIYGLYLYYSNNSSDSDNTENNDSTVTDENKHLTEVEEVVNNIFLSTDTTKEKIDSVIGGSFLFNTYYVLGTDSFLRSTLDTDEDISEYEKLQKTYAAKVEESYLNGTTYTASKSGDSNLYFAIKPWYFTLYSSDLTSIISKLLEMANVDSDLMQTNYDEYELYYYKAKVKAMIILNDYLDNYNNKDEEFDFIFYYNGDVPDANQYYSLYCNLVGAASKYMAYTTDMINEQKDRVDNYINEAIASGIIDENDPLKINS